MFYFPSILVNWFLYFYRLVYVETSAATGQNVALAVEMLLDKIMIRMDQAVEDAFGQRGRIVHMEVNNIEF